MLKMEMDGLVDGPAFLARYATFNASPQLDLRYARVRVVDGTDVKAEPPAVASLYKETVRVAEMFPLTYTALRVSRAKDLTIAASANLPAEALLALVRLVRLEEMSSDQFKSAIYVAAQSGEIGGALSGNADGIPGTAVSARFDRSGTLAHEVAHALGEFHPVNVDIFHTFLPVDPDPVFLPETEYASGPTCYGRRLAAPLGRAVDFPYWKDNRRPLIGPLAGATVNDVVYGLAGGSQPSAIRVVRPDDVTDLMMGGYCGNEENWTSSHTYGRLRAAMLARQPIA